MGSPILRIGKASVGVSVQQFQPIEEQVADGDGSIFVSIVSYRDGERCGETLKNLFENAKDPDKVFVGLVEQNDALDKFCLEEYCAYYGVKSHKRQKIREDVTKIVTMPNERAKCPHYDQVRLVGLHHYAAKGPMYARSLTRKVLGNEEFCMQIDAHSDFTPNWDELAKSEWKKTRNEFAIISHVPPKLATKEEGTMENATPRQCRVHFRDNGYPDYEDGADAGVITDLDEPLLSYTWSAAFSFAKCHLEESAPNDPFAWFAQPIEQFSRFARFWTRGYDVYTPIRTITYHNYGTQENGHGNSEWFQRQRERFRKEALQRAKTIVEAEGGVTTPNAQANMGIYGLGKRRTLQQLLDFSGLSFTPSRIGNKGKKCGTVEYVPYDPKISPVANLYDKPDNLDPQPEYPLRTKLLYYEQVDSLQYAAPMIGLTIHGNGTVGGLVTPVDLQPQRDALEFGEGYPEGANLPSLSTLLLLWCFGLIVWCTVFMNPISVDAQTVKRKIKKRVKEANFKDV